MATYYVFGIELAPARGSGEVTADQAARMEMRMRQFGMLVQQLALEGWCYVIATTESTPLRSLDNAGEGVVIAKDVVQLRSGSYGAYEDAGDEIASAVEAWQATHPNDTFKSF